MTKQTLTDPNGSADHGTDETRPFGRMLVAIDESPAAVGAVHLVAEWVEGPGADVRFLQVSEGHRQERGGVETELGAVAPQQAHHLMVSASTLGARNRQLVRGIADAAADFGADVIVLGFDRPRLAGHRLAPSLREQIMRLTDLPVLVVPSPKPDTKRHHRLPDLHRHEERADSDRPYAHV
ncbi:MAG TPA: universal stress protein [Acidimicrobiales bacterium]|nr:universal stress protein [Acidimicrobiales bacterium]